MIVTTKPTRLPLSTTVRLLRQQAICMNSAIDDMARAAAASNPDKMLRCWTAEQSTKLAAKRGGK